MKKLLCIVLCLIMVLSCFAACGNDTTPDTTAGKNVETNPPAVDDPTEAPVDKLREDEGKTITFAHNQGEYIWEKFYEIGDKFEELTGIKVEFQEIPSSDWDTWVTAQLAAGTEPDILMSSPSAKDYFDQGKFVDLTAYYEQENVFNGKKWADCFV